MEKKQKDYMPWIKRFLIWIACGIARLCKFCGDNCPFCERQSVTAWQCDPA